MTKPLPPCIDCQRPLRRRSEPAGDGRVLHQARGLCGACYERTYGRIRRSRARLTDEDREQRRRQQLAKTMQRRRARLAAHIPAAPIEEGWEQRATCLTVGPDVFDDPTHTAAARALCDACPSRRSCLEAALIEEAGTPASYRAHLRGGLTPGERVRLENLRRDRQEPAA